MYEVGKAYALPFKGVIIKGDNQYLVVSDGDKDYTIKPYDYQTEYSIFPKVIQCYVWKLGLNGKPYMEQLRDDILQDRYYLFGKEHEFVIDKLCIDQNTNHSFFMLSDEFGIQHRYYPTGDDVNKKSGDGLTLIVKGIIPSRQGKNNARLDLAAPSEGVTPVVSPAPVYPKNSGKKNFGCEDEKKEFKSSIVFPAGKVEADIDTQLGIICRTIAGFMNASGGTLYIGVSDNGYICGIEDDYSHLNDSDLDKYTYKENDDGYLQKITNAICMTLGHIAGTLISMRIEQEDGKKYCIIDIKKASRPIWYVWDGENKLFVRMVTTNRKLFRDEITQFVLDRTSKNSFAKQKKSESPVIDSNSDDEVVNTTQPVASPVAKTTPQVTQKQKKPSKAWRYITFYDNGEWSFQKENVQGDDVVYAAVVPSDARQNNHILILAYENGHIEATYLKSLLYGKKGLLPEGKRRGQGLFADNGKLVSAFCANKKDMLLLTSELSGDLYVKALDVDTLGIHDKMGKGNEIIREKGSKLVRAVYIPNDDGARISLKGSGIFIEKNQKYTKGGVRLASLAPGYRSFISGFEEAV